MPNSSASFELLNIESGILLVVIGLLLSSQLRLAVARRNYFPDRYFKASTLAFVVLGIAFTWELSAVSPLFGLELAAGFVLGLLEPVNALCLFLALLLLRPWEVMPGNALLSSLPRAVSLLWVASFLIDRVARGRLRMRPGREGWTLLAFAAWTLITAFRAIDLGSAQSLWMDSYSRSLALFFMCLATVNDELSARTLRQTLVWSVFGMALLAYFDYIFTPIAWKPDDRLRSVGLLEDPNDFAAVAVLALPMAASALFRPAHLSSRLCGMVISLALLGAVWLSRSRGALLALLVMIGVALILKMRRKWIGFAAAGGLYGIYGVLLATFQRSADDMAASTSARIAYWKAGAAMALKNPIFGVGFGQFPAQYESYSPTLEFEWGLRTAHSSWILAFAENGFPGGLLFVAFAALCGKSAWEIRREHPELFLSFVGYTVAMIFLSHTYFLYPYILFGLIAAQGANARKTPAAA